MTYHCAKRFFWGFAEQSDVRPMSGTALALNVEAKYKHLRIQLDLV